MGTIECGAVDVGVVTTTAGMNADELDTSTVDDNGVTGDVGATDPLPDDTAKEETGVGVVETDVGATGADEGSVEALGFVEAVPATDDEGVGPADERGPVGDAVGVETGTTAVSVGGTLALTESGGVDETGTMVNGVAVVKIGAGAADVPETIGTIGTRVAVAALLTPVPAALETPDTIAGIKGVPVAETMSVPVPAPVSPTLSGVAVGAAGAEERIAGVAGALEAEMMVDSPTMMPVGALVETTAGASTELEDAARGLAGRSPVEPATRGTIAFEEAVDAGIATETSD